MSWQNVLATGLVLPVLLPTSADIAAHRRDAQCARRGGKASLSTPQHPHELGSQDAPAIASAGIRTYDRLLLRRLVTPFAVIGGTLAVGPRRAAVVHLPTLLWYVPARSLPAARRPTPEAGQYISADRTEARQILSLQDLRGRVHLRSPADALAFVRLGTSPLWRFWGPDPVDPLTPGTYELIEPVVRERISLTTAYGLREGVRTLRQQKSGSEGVLSAQEAGALGVGSAYAARRGSGYEVVRVLLRLKYAFGQVWLGHDLVRVWEWIGTDGASRVERQVVLPLPQAPQLDWSAFWYG